MNAVFYHFDKGNVLIKGGKVFKYESKSTKIKTIFPKNYEMHFFSN